MLARQHAPGLHPRPSRTAAAPGFRAWRLQDAVHELSVARRARRTPISSSSTYRLSGDLDRTASCRSRGRRCAPMACGGTAASRLSSATPAGPTTGNTTSRRRAPGRPITSATTAKAWRRSLKGAAPAVTPRIRHRLRRSLACVLDLSWLARSPQARDCVSVWRAVIEDKARVLSYWALKHPAEKPDFHHADSFVVELD